MSFLFRKKQKSNDIPQNPISKKKIRKVFWTVFISILIVVISFVAYVFSSGSRVFERGLGGTGGLIKTIYGSRELLKGENEDRINILLMGMGGTAHPGGLLTDSIMILSIRPSDKKTAFISIPRDLLVTIPDVGEGKINAILATGYNNYLAKNCKKKAVDSCRNDAIIAGANLEADTIAKLFDLPIHYYLLADFSGFEKLIDQLGGIDVYVDKAINDPIFPADDMVHYSPFKIAVGQHHLDGETALKYARSRETTSDFDRAARQQKIIGAIKEKAMDLGMYSNPKRALEIIDTLGNSMKTNFQANEIKSFVEIIKETDRESIISKVFTNGVGGELEDRNNGTYYLVPKNGNYKLLQNEVKNIFDDAVQEGANIEIINSSGRAGAALSLSKELEEQGYNIVKLYSAKPLQEKTSIVDYTGNLKIGTLNVLTKKLGAKVVAQKPLNNSNVEISIIIGKDYSTN